MVVWPPSRTPWPGQRPRPRARQPPSVAARDETPVLRKSRTRRRLSAARIDTPGEGARQMAEPTAQRLRVTFTVTRADNGRFVLACDPLESERTLFFNETETTE